MFYIVEYVFELISYEFFLLYWVWYEIGIFQRCYGYSYGFELINVIVRYEKCIFFWNEVMDENVVFCFFLQE